jgi:hypothetical protein
MATGTVKIFSRKKPRKWIISPETMSLTSLPGLHAAESHVSDFCNSHSSLVYDIVNVYMIQATSSQS